MSFRITQNELLITELLPVTFQLALTVTIRLENYLLLFNELLFFAHLYCLPYTMVALHCLFNYWMSSWEAIITKFYILWFDSTGNRTQVFRFSSICSVHSTYLSSIKYFCAIHCAAVLETELIKALFWKQLLWSMISVLYLSFRIWSFRGLKKNRKSQND